MNDNLPVSEKTERMVTEMINIYQREQPSTVEAVQALCSLAFNVVSVSQDQHAIIDAIITVMRNMKKAFPANGETIQ